MFDPATNEQILQLLLAALFGGILGIERDLHARPAGLRTSMIVTVGACLFTILSIEGFRGAETSRVAAQIVTGIGFIGGGVILKDDEKIHGLTTAAHIWLAAALGMTIGVRMYALATAVVILAVCILVFLRPVSARLDMVGSNNAKKRGEFFRKKKRR